MYFFFFLCWCFLFCVSVFFTVLKRRNLLAFMIFFIKIFLFIHLLHCVCIVSLNKTVLNSIAFASFYVIIFFYLFLIIFTTIYQLFLTVTLSLLLSLSLAHIHTFQQNIFNTFPIVCLPYKWLSFSLSLFRSRSRAVVYHQFLLSICYILFLLRISVPFQFCWVCGDF